MKNVKELRGQKIASRLLERYLTGPVPPLMIFYGPDGVGKWSVAEAFIRQKLCHVGTGCGSCASCRKLDRDDHPDFIRFPLDRILIGEQENQEEFTIRWLIQTRLRYSPFEAPLRFVLFPAAEQIQNEAETALLKTLEEPPHHTRFIFLVRSLDQLKATIVSRGVAIPFGLLPGDVMRSLLGGQGEELLEVLGGSLHLLPFFQTDLAPLMEEKIGDSLNHPLRLLELEKWLLSGEKKVFEELTGEEHFHYTEILEIFGLLFLKRIQELPQRDALTRILFEFKEELHRDQSGMIPYIMSRFFHDIASILYPPEA